MRATDPRDRYPEEITVPLGDVFQLIDALRDALREASGHGSRGPGVDELATGTAALVRALRIERFRERMSDWNEELDA